MSVLETHKQSALKKKTFNIPKKLSQGYICIEMKNKTITKQTHKTVWTAEYSGASTTISSTSHSISPTTNQLQLQ